MRLSKFSNELLVKKYHNGIKLVRPDSSSQFSHSIAQILQFPFETYMLSTGGIIQLMNPALAETYQLESIASGIGKTIFDFSTEEDAYLIRANDSAVLKNNKMKIAEECVNNKKTKILTNFLSIKFPCYDEHEILVGIFGFSIALGIRSIAQFLTQLTELGILNSNAMDPLPNSITHLTAHHLPQPNAMAQFTKREIDVIHYLLRGKTSKGIAASLNLSTRTVENYLATIKDKLNVATKSELIEKLLPLLL